MEFGGEGGRKDLKGVKGGKRQKQNILYGKKHSFSKENKDKERKRERKGLLTSEIVLQPAGPGCLGLSHFICTPAVGSSSVRKLSPLKKEQLIPSTSWR